MIRQVKNEGVKAIVHNSNFKIFSITFLAIAAFALNACTGNAPGNSTIGGGNVDVNETAATVNGKVIKLQEIERVRTADLNLPHVAEVEQPGHRSYRPVLGEDAFVLHGHFPPGERYDPGAQRLVPVEQCRLLQRFVLVFHTFPLGHQTRSNASFPTSV